MGPGSQAEPTSSANCLSAETNGFDQSLSITPTSIQIRSNVQSSVKSKRASLGAAQLAIDVDEVRGSAIAESSITGASVSVDADAAVIRERACYGNISGTAELLSADAKASASIGPNGASAEASAGAYLAKDTGSMSIPHRCIGRCGPWSRSERRGRCVGDQRGQIRGRSGDRTRRGIRNWNST